MRGYKGVGIGRSSDLADLLAGYRSKRQEHFLVVTLNRAHEIIKVHVVSKGTANSTAVHPRECFYPAIKDNAVAVMFAHNHPSGRIEPSVEDDEITNRLKKCADLLGFTFLDHIIIGNGFYSYGASGRIGEPEEGVDASC
jgi:DNA repair protein RadC